MRERLAAGADASARKEAKVELARLAVEDQLEVAVGRARRQPGRRPAVVDEARLVARCGRVDAERGRRRVPAQPQLVGVELVRVRVVRVIRVRGDEVAEIETNRLADLDLVGGDGGERELGRRREERDRIERRDGTHDADARLRLAARDGLQEFAIRATPVRLILVRLSAGTHRLQNRSLAGEPMRAPARFEVIAAGKGRFGRYFLEFRATRESTGRQLEAVSESCLLYTSPSPRD